MSLHFSDAKLLNDLPVWESGSKYAGKIKRKSMVGMSLMFDYRGCVYENIYVFKYIEGSHPKFIVKYNNEKYIISCECLIKGRIGRILGLITNSFKVNIGTLFNDNNRNITILNKEYRDNGRQKCKFYKYKCNICLNEDWISEPHLLKCKNGCNACCRTPRKTLLGVNTIWDTAPWMIDLGVDKEEAKKYTKASSKKIKCVCPHCGEVKYKAINNIYSHKSISCSCGDGVSYPEKLTYSLLKQINIPFVTQYKINNKYFDFYVPSLNCIVESHGEQHYKQANGVFSRPLLQEQENDKFKKELALNNGIECYVELDCSKSELEYIKNSILNSKLNGLFDLSNIDWLKCEEYALGNLIKEVCDYWNNKQESETTTDVGIIYNMCGVSISNYLKKGTKLGWCNYDADDEKIKTIHRNAKKSHGKKVKVFKNNVSFGIFNSCHELSRISEEMLGIKLSVNSISQSCLGKRKNRNGYTFKYV